MSQINPFNGGAVYPGDSVLKDQLKDLKLTHDTDKSVVYSPLEGKTVPISKLTLSVGGSDAKVYDPLGADVSVDIPKGVTIVTADIYGSGQMSSEQYSKMSEALERGETVIVSAPLGGSATYYTLCAQNPAVIVFCSVGNEEVRVLYITTGARLDGSHECELIRYPLSMNSMFFIRTGSGGEDVGHEYTKCTEWASSGEKKLPVLIYQNGSSQQYIGNFAGTDGGGYLFVAMDGSTLKGFRVAGDGDIKVFDIVGGAPDGSYIRQTEVSQSGWLKDWASENGMNFGDIVGVVCSSGNNVHYRGGAYAAVDNCGCVPCGFIVFLDERGENALASDEARNVSLDMTISFDGSTAYSPEEAKAKVPDTVWLRVFSIRDHGHFPLSAPLGFTDGMFVNGDSIHLQDITAKDESTQTYKTLRRARVLVSIIGGSWSFSYEEV